MGTRDPISRVGFQRRPTQLVVPSLPKSYVVGFVPSSLDKDALTPPEYYGPLFDPEDAPPISLEVLQRLNAFVQDWKGVVGNEQQLAQSFLGG